jgi:hypothetical protein
VGVVTGVYGLIQIPEWISDQIDRLDPEIQAVDPVDGSPFVLPFRVRIRSTWFDMPNVLFTCGVDLVYAEDVVGQKVIIRDEAFVTGTQNVTNEGISYQCDASDLLRVRTDGSLSAYGAYPVFETKAIFRPPFHVLKMCVWIGGEYTVAHIVSWHFRSDIWQWPAMPTLHQWVKRPVAPGAHIDDGPYPKLEEISGGFALRGLVIDRNGHRELRFDAVRCSDAVQSPYGLTLGLGQQKLVW